MVRVADSGGVTKCWLDREELSRLERAVAEDAERPERWRAVSSHDLRRSWATYHLVERRVDVRTTMAICAWSDDDAIEPYLAAPTQAWIGTAVSV